MRCIARQRWAMWTSSPGIILLVGILYLCKQCELTASKEVNMANNAQAYQRGEHPGYEETAWEGIKQTIDVIAEKKIKVVINGGALNPKGLALKIDELVGLFPPTVDFV